MSLPTHGDIENQLSIDLSRDSRVGQTRITKENEMVKHEPAILPTRELVMLRNFENILSKLKNEGRETIRCILMTVKEWN
jgi:hypothetical protein